MKRFLLSLSLLVFSSVQYGFAQTETVAPDPLESALAAARKAPRNKVAQREAADRLFDAGRYSEAISYYLKSDNSGNLGAARAAFELYDFEGAREYLSKYLAKRTKAERERDLASTGDGSDPTDILSAKIILGDDMLGRVENIQVIDSVNVPADDFFSWIRLAASAGSIVGTEVVEQIVPAKFIGEEEYIVSPAYLTEEADRLFWAKADESDSVTLYESTLLVDGTWGEPVELFSHASIFDEDADGNLLGHPFLMPDGVTLYFSADGERSLGGLDIFTSRRDERGFLQPSNVGMPYNSPANDYMLAIDEETGIGWWATDRNNLTDSVTIYVFIPSEVRVNYPADKEGLTDLARLSSISLTRNPADDHRALLRRIASLQKGNSSRQVNRRKGPDFMLALPDGRIITRLSDFTSAIARKSMQEYLDADKAYQTSMQHLSSLRERYAKGDRSVASEILQLEKRLEGTKTHLLELRNQVIDSEI
ncbi:MAG: hypothetical protein K2K55_02565 [Duncaniella sp.]|nr:hypothetical protein [Duncaniella sp.]